MLALRAYVTPASVDGAVAGYGLSMQENKRVPRLTKGRETDRRSSRSRNRERERERRERERGEGGRDWEG